MGTWPNAKFTSGDTGTRYGGFWLEDDGGKVTLESVAAVGMNGMAASDVASFEYKIGLVWANLHSRRVCPYAKGRDAFGRCLFSPFESSGMAPL